LCHNFASIDSVFWVLGRLPAEMFGELKKSPFLSPIFGAREPGKLPADKLLGHVCWQEKNIPFFSKKHDLSIIPSNSFFLADFDFLLHNST
jgi:hypothetical protein